MSDLYLRKHRACFLLWWWEWRMSTPARAWPPRICGGKGCISRTMCSHTRERAGILDLVQEWPLQKWTDYLLIQAVVTHIYSETFQDAHLRLLHLCVCYTSIKTAFKKREKPHQREIKSIAGFPRAMESTQAVSWRTHQPLKGNFRWVVLSNSMRSSSKDHIESLRRRASLKPWQCTEATTYCQEEKLFKSIYEVWLKNTLNV